MSQFISKDSERTINRVPDRLLVDNSNVVDSEDLTSRRRRALGKETSTQSWLYDEDSIGKRLTQRRAAENLLLLKKTPLSPQTYKRSGPMSPSIQMSPDLKSKHIQIIDKRDPLLSHIGMRHQTALNELSQLYSVSLKTRDYIDTLYSKLTKILYPLPRKWMYYEFFYSTYDRQYFLYNEFNEILLEMNIHKQKMNRKEWNILRKRMGTVRRLSPVFLSEERTKLYQFREALLHAQKEQVDSMFEFNHVQYSIPVPYVIGQTVYALHPIYKYIAKGLIVSISPNSDSVIVLFDDIKETFSRLSVTEIATEGIPIFINSPNSKSPIPSEISSNLLKVISKSDAILLNAFTILLQRKNVLLNELSRLSYEPSQSQLSNTYCFILENLKNTDLELDILHPLINILQRMLRSCSSSSRILDVLSMVEIYINTLSSSIQSQYHIQSTDSPSYTIEQKQLFSKLMSNTLIITVLLITFKIVLESNMPKNIGISLITLLRTRFTCHFSENKNSYESLMNIFNSFLQQFNESNNSRTQNLSPTLINK